MAAVQSVDGIGELYISKKPIRRALRRQFSELPPECFNLAFAQAKGGLKTEKRSYAEIL